MPLSPFIGLSVLIHLGTILVFKLLNWKTNEVVITTRKKPTSFMRYTSLVIVFIVFTFVSTSATLLVYGSITEKHSTIHFVSNHLSAITNFDYLPITNVSAAVVEPEPTTPATPVQAFECFPNKLISSTKNQLSLDK